MASPAQSRRSEMAQASGNRIALKEIVESFSVGINEEQGWAVLSQALRWYQARSITASIGTSPNSADIFSSKQGTFGVRPDIANLFLDKEGCVTVVDSRVDRDECGEAVIEEGKFLEHLAMAVWDACQHNTRENEEAPLSEEFGTLILQLSDDENDSLTRITSIEEVLQITERRNKNDGDASEHYQAVCRALVVECFDFREFLLKVQSEKLMDKENCPAVTASDLGATPCNSWARAWIQVIRELRAGFRLRKVEDTDSNLRSPGVYELTPYEMLMEDIRMRRFSLKNTPSNEERKPRSPADPHDRILEYIRSRPPLSPVQNRRLRPKPANHTPGDLLMDSIRLFAAEKLRKAPLPEPKNHFENYRSRPRFQSPEDPHELLNPLTLASSTMTALPSESTPPSSIAPKRKLIIPDVEAAPINFLLENHDTSGDIEEENELDLKEYSAEGAGGDGVPTDISERSKKSPYPDVVSLTLDEIALIRGALAKAELENLEEQDARLFDDIRRSKVCFSCRRVRFSQFVWMFREGGVKCHLCQNTICASCSRQMVLPCDRLDRIPVHTLSPALDDDDLALPEPAHRQPVLQQRPISSASTMPRQRSQLQRSHTLEFVSSTLPKPQTRSRPALQRGLTISSAPNSSRHQHSPWPPAPAMRRKISLPSEEPPSSFTMQVCVECHSVLYHAIMESQTPPLSASRAASSIRKPGISYHTSASSVISDSRSDSLEDDEDFCDLSDFVDEVGQTTGHAHQQRNGMHLGVVLGSGGPHRGDESVSPANSRSDSTSSEAGSFYSNHI